MLRRRTGKDKVPQPDNLVSGSNSEEARLRAEFGDAKVKQLILKPRSKRRNGFIFVLGGLFGIFIALFFANQSEVISLDSLMDLNLDSLMDAIPQGIVSDVRQFSVSDSERAALLSLRYVHVTDDLGLIAARTRYR
jgi:phospholipid:diacylglycerol acyltransferase